MKYLRIAIASISLLIGSIANTALADDKALVQVFYDFLSNASSEKHADAIRDVT